tara:strand:+ start:333 stop:524 length:192 start_codon:yes stop_codon:yes gene_type:complete
MSNAFMKRTAKKKADRDKKQAKRDKAAAEYQETAGSEEGGERRKLNIFQRAKKALIKKGVLKN